MDIMAMTARPDTKSKDGLFTDAIDSRHRGCHAGRYSKSLFSAGRCLVEHGKHVRKSEVDLHRAD